MLWRVGELVRKCHTHDTPRRRGSHLPFLSLRTLPAWTLTITELLLLLPPPGLVTLNSPSLSSYLTRACASQELRSSKVEAGKGWTSLLCANPFWLLRSSDCCSELKRATSYH